MIKTKYTIKYRHGLQARASDKFSKIKIICEGKIKKSPASMKS
jgi:hypothetical protein